MSITDGSAKMSHLPEVGARMRGWTARDLLAPNLCGVDPMRPGIVVPFLREHAADVAESSKLPWRR